MHVIITIPFAQIFSSSLLNQYIWFLFLLEYMLGANKLVNHWTVTFFYRKVERDFFFSLQKKQKVNLASNYRAGSLCEEPCHDKYSQHQPPSRQVNFSFITFPTSNKHHCQSTNGNGKYIILIAALVTVEEQRRLNLEKRLSTSQVKGVQSSDKYIFILFLSWKRG